jgi:hypothetical protein
LGLNAAVGRFDDAIAAAGPIGIEGNPEDAGAAVPVELAHQFENTVRQFGIEIFGRPNRAAMRANT